MPLPADNMEALFLKWMKGDSNAVEFLLNIAYITRLADDIVDGDSKDVAADMAHLLYRALIMPAKNPFYLANEEALSAIMVNALMKWEQSERWKGAPDEKTRIFAYIYREGIQEVLYASAKIVGGYKHAIKVMDELHQQSHLTSPETFADWEKEHGHVL